MKLAFLIPQTTNPSEGMQVSIPVDRSEIGELAPHLGDPVLVFGNAQAGGGEVYGQARFVALQAGQQGKRQHHAQLEIVETFSEPVALPLQMSVIRDTWRGLDDAVFRNVLSAAGSILPRELDEVAQPPFEFEKQGKQAAPPVGLVALQNSVRRDYGDRCALTGTPHSKTTPVLVFPIRPLSAGEHVQAGNCIPLIEAAGDAFNHVHLTIGEDMEIVADLSRIDPELMETLNANGRLRLPARRAARPSTDALSWHRQQFFRRIGIV